MPITDSAKSIATIGTRNTVATPAKITVIKLPLAISLERCTLPGTTRTTIIDSTSNISIIIITDSAALSLFCT